MPTKMRLTRHGKKGRPFYHIVIADGRAPRDGRFIEKIGTYDPIPNPADIVLDFDKALDWLQKGAQPTDTVRRILSYKGIMLKKHLQIGVLKGAITQEQADKKFDDWAQGKEAEISKEVDSIQKKKAAEAKAKFDAEVKINEAKAEAIKKKLAALVPEEEVAEGESTEEATEETTAEETKEEPAAEAPLEEKAEEAKEEPAPEAKEEPVVEEKKEEPKAEEVKEEVTEEPKAEEAPKEEVKEEPKAEETPKEEEKAEAKEEPKAEAPAEEEKKEEDKK